MVASGFIAYPTVQRQVRRVYGLSAVDFQFVDRVCNIELNIFFIYQVQSRRHWKQLQHLSHVPLRLRTALEPQDSRRRHDAYFCQTSGPSIDNILSIVSCHADLDQAGFPNMDHIELQRKHGHGILLV